MTTAADIRDAVVSFDVLEEKIRSSKSEKSVRNYVAVINRLRTFTGLEYIALCDISPEFVSRFENYLLSSGVTPSSANYFKMILRAIFKDEFGKKRQAEFKAAFKDVASTNTAETCALTFRDITYLLSLGLDGKLYLEKIRDVFFFCVYGGGMTYAALKRSTDSQTRLTRHQRALAERFVNTYECDFFRFVSALSEENYSKGLSVIGGMSGIRHRLTPASARDAYKTIAASVDINQDLIGLTAADETETASLLNNDEIIAIRETVSDRLWDIRPRWYAMRCYGIEPEDMILKIKDADISGCDDTFETFVAPRPAGKTIPGSTASVIGTLLFFRCSPSTASEIRKSVKDTAWVYTLAGTSVPAQISPSEMRTFMLLCEVGEGSVSYHFPQAGGQISPVMIGQQAEIIDGDFVGHVGIVSALSDNKYKVAITFTTLCATITAEVPVDFIKV